MLDKSRIKHLEQVDPDRYRAALLAPSAQRQQLITFYAFHAELAKIPEIVSEPMIGAIRYQWWRDAIEEIYAGKAVRKHDIAVPLCGLIRDLDLNRFAFDSLIDARERDLDPTPFANLEDAREYGLGTSGRIMQIASAILNKEVPSEAIANLGMSWGLAGLARGWRYYHRGMLSNLSFKNILQDTEVAFNECRETLGRVEAAIVPAIAYGSFIPAYLKAMSNSEYEPETMAPHYGQLSKKLRLLRVSLTGKI